MSTATPIASPQQVTNSTTTLPWQKIPLDDPLQLQALYGMFGGPAYWASQGYTGPAPQAMGPVDNITGDSAPGNYADWAKWVQDKGYGYNVAQDESGFRHGQLTQNGQAVAGIPEAQWSAPDNTGFNITGAIVAAGLAAGGGMAAGLGGGAGAGTAAGAGGSAAGGNMALIESGLGTAGYGASSAGTIATGTVGGSTAADLASKGIDGGTNLFENAANTPIPPSYSATSASGGLTPTTGGGSLSQIGKTLSNADLLKLGIAGAGALASGSGAGGGGDASASLEAQRRAADNAYALGMSQLDFQKQQYADGAADRAQASATAKQVADRMLASSTQADAIAKEYDDYRKGTFVPLEKQIVSEATAYDTPERRAAAAEAARADVDIGFARQQQANAARLASAGINPGSARSIAAMGGAGVEAAKAGAGASYMARKGVEDTGTAMKLNAASLGRNLPANQNASANTAINAGNAATNNATVPTAINQSAAASLNTPYQSAINAALGSGSQYGQNAAITKGVNDSNSAAWGALGSTLGSYLGSTGGQKTLDSIADWISDENVKKDIEPVSEGDALAAVNATPVKKWRYDPAKLAANGIQSDGGAEHIGPMAQDVNATMGDKVAPGGKTIDPITMNGVTMRGLQAVDKKVERLAKQVTSIASMVRSGRMEARAA